MCGFVSQLKLSVCLVYLVNNGKRPGTMVRRNPIGPFVLADAQHSEYMSASYLAAAAARALDQNNQTPPNSESPFLVKYINLERRVDRRQSCEALLKACELHAVSERFEAIDGLALWRKGMLSAACKDSVTPRALQDEALDKGWVMGGDLTPGAAALCATTLNLLKQHASGDSARRRQLLLILEDDVELAAGASATAVRDLLTLLTQSEEGTASSDDGGRAARALDWDVLLIGSHPESEVLDEVTALPSHLGGSLRRTGTREPMVAVASRCCCLCRHSALAVIARLPLLRFSRTVAQVTSSDSSPIVLTGLNLPREWQRLSSHVTIRLAPRVTSQPGATSAPWLLSSVPLLSSAHGSLTRSFASYPIVHL